MILPPSLSSSKGLNATRSLPKSWAWNSKLVTFNSGFHKPSSGDTVAFTSASKHLAMCMSGPFAKSQFNKGKPCGSNSGMEDGASLTSPRRVPSVRGSGERALCKPGVGPS